MIGRQRELECPKQYLNDRNVSHFCYYWARGGLGKTRLLQEVQQLVQDTRSGYHSNGIWDLYHTDLHGISDLARAIVDGLDPQGKHCANYRFKRPEYESLRDRGASPKALEALRTKLSRLLEECRGKLLFFDKTQRRGHARAGVDVADERTVRDDARVWTERLYGGGIETVCAAFDILLDMPKRGYGREKAGALFLHALPDRRPPKE
jgi:hypothetical protein